MILGGNSEMTCLAPKGKHRNWEINDLFSTEKNKWELGNDLSWHKKFNSWEKIGQAYWWYRLFRFCKLRVPNIKWNVDFQQKQIQLICGKWNLYWSYACCQSKSRRSSSLHKEIINKRIEFERCINCEIERGRIETKESGWT